MTKKSFSQFRNIVTLGLGIVLLTLTSASYSQSYSTNNDTVFRDARGNLYVPNASNNLIPIYPVGQDLNSSGYITQSHPPYYTYSPPVYTAPAPVYQEPIYTSNVVSDLAPWLLLGGAAIAISNHNSNRYYESRYNYRPYHYRPPVYYSHRPIYNNYDNRNYRGRGHR